MAWTKEAQPTSSQEGQTVMVLSEEVVDDSDKTLAFDTDVGTGEKAEVLGIRVELTTSATVGNRQISIRVLDSAADIVREVRSNGTVVASTTKVFELAPGLVAVDQGAGFQQEPLPSKFMFLKGQSLQVLDGVVVDPTVDDMIVHVTLGVSR